MSIKQVLVTSFFNVESLHNCLSAKLVAMQIGDKNGKALLPELRFGSIHIYTLRSDLKEFKNRHI